jgi:hypothetical protein
MLENPLKSADKIHPLAIKRSSQLTNLIIIRNLGVLLFGLWLLFVAVAFVLKLLTGIIIFADPYQISGPNQVGYLGFVGIFLSFLYMRTTKNDEQKRQAAVQGESKLLADRYPSPKAAEISLPLKIHYQAYWPFFWIIGALVLLLFIFSSVAFTWRGLSVDSIVTIIVLAIIACALTVMTVINRIGKWLIADENGLTVKTFESSKGRYIAWSEARLFAIDAAPTNRSKFTNIQYPPKWQLELASDREVINWPVDATEGIDDDVALQIVNPTDPYVRDLQALHVVIEEKTGLALCDLRKSL